MNNKKDFFSTVFCIFIAVLLILGCNNHLLKLQQDEPRLIVKIEDSTGARNVSSETEYNVTAWIENRDGSQSHYQEISTKENNLILTFEDLVIGSQINIHLELIENDDTQTKLTGESGWITVKAGEQVIEIELKSMTNTDDSGEGNGSTSDGETEGDEPAIVDAETPVITQQPHGKSQTFEPNTATSITTTLEIAATVGDGGDLTYQWYSNTSNSTSGGTLINGATNKSYTASTAAKTTTYYYCVITNTNNDVNGKTTASVTSHIAAISSIEGELTSITAQYTGTGYQLVNTELNYDDIEIQQTYTAGSETQVVTVSAEEVKDQYTIDLPENTIGMVPATVTHITETQIKDDFTIPVKYQLDARNLTISGDASVEQNEELKLTAEYKIDGKDSYNLYTSESSSGSYKIIEKVNISWQGATKQQNAWEALAETSNAGTGKTATVTLTSKDEWCVTTGGVEKSHSYEVIVLPSDGYFVSADGSDSNAGTYNAPYKTLANAINQARIDNKTIYIMGELTATSENSSDSETVFFVENAVGSTENPIIIEGYGTGATLNASGSNKRVFETNATSYIIMRNLTITGGNISSGSGGGIYYYQGDLTLENCIVTNNSTSNAAHDGIYMYGSNNYLTMKNTKVENDSVYLYNTGKADLGTGCVFGDITSDTSSITLSEDVTINGILNYKTNGGGITIATTLSSTIPIKLNVVNPNSSSTILRVSAGLDINNEYTKFTLQNTDYTWNIYNGVGYLQAALN